MLALKLSMDDRGLIESGHYIHMDSAARNLELFEGPNCYHFTPQFSSIFDIQFRRNGIQGYTFRTLQQGVIFVFQWVYDNSCHTHVETQLTS